MAIFHNICRVALVHLSGWLATWVVMAHLAWLKWQPESPLGLVRVRMMIDKENWHSRVNVSPDLRIHDPAVAGVRGERRRGRRAAVHRQAHQRHGLHQNGKRLFR